MDSIAFLMVYGVAHYVDWCVRYFFWCIFRIDANHKPGGGAAAGFRENQVGVICLSDEDHVTGMVSYEFIRVCVHTLEQHSGFGIGVFG